MSVRPEFTCFGGKRVHLGVCGSIASCKSPDLLRMLLKSGVSVGATLTRSAQEFVRPLLFEALGAAPVYSGMFPSEAPASPDIFGHLEPGQNADAMLVAPATANIIAKLASGIADDMLSAQALAFRGPLLLAPAMNPRLWEAEATRENWEKLKRRGCICLEPGLGSMACGEEGQGRLPDVYEICMRTLRALAPQDLAGRRVLVTLGPTREMWDGVRFWSNPSSGAMGASLAAAAWLRGAEVTAVVGPCEVRMPEGVRVLQVRSAREMYDAAMVLWPDTDIGCLTAAVADFRPVPVGREKYKKDQLGDGRLAIEFELNADILRTMGQNKKAGQMLVGFAAETSNLVENARRKLQNKNCDMLAANVVGVPESGFEASTNRIVLLDRTGREESWPVLPKSEVAWRIWDHVSLLSS
ncbi:phosphopantothenoylcysteine decarboxylase/phosphopantothenate/cysteine ligase [Desulfovibrio sp. X2]|uniref:bifunctional phosphopantothenoylcysteine decarboxylase/phosphopantothenate--cysteine ligase CoaBC n=1 Tax=Desulfovibrio sp. X2 TaxID=941449 RepID=UPI000358A903|nr:bifunctional phosphopantothenoylcysteine decarboxylase/phosphopantothenate--cysteine ligase CoaBC [Desulfovibrio sp. X2]EPR44015.1 phosphopantothenoylcysteine decarboxylase/phosphopantothenate/cysteine ligase [Desulfovibrio sp. X2]